MVSSGLDGIGFQEHDGPGTAAMIDRLIWIWAQGSPNGDAGLRRRLALRHTGCKGFRCLTASSDDAIIGYAYGMYDGQGTGLGEPGSVISLGSHDLLAELIARESEGRLIRTDPEWLAAHDIAEVQVLADYRSRGIGEALVRKLCRSLPADDRVVLTVEPQNATAQRVYERVGFRDLYGVPVISRLLALNPQILMGLGRAGDA
jgi:GNAT superfamily N-acetyltransferase